MKHTDSLLSKKHLLKKPFFWTAPVPMPALGFLNPEAESGSGLRFPLLYLLKVQNVEHFRH